MLKFTALHFPNFTFNHTMTDWTRLKGRPNHIAEELQLTRVSGNVREFETRNGKRYRCIEENGNKQWFTFRTNQIMKRATRAGIQICCKKFERSFGIFLDGRKGAAVGAQLSSQINFPSHHWRNERLRNPGKKFRHRTQLPNPTNIHSLPCS